MMNNAKHLNNQHKKEITPSLTETSGISSKVT